MMKNPSLVTSLPYASDPDEGSPGLGSRSDQMRLQFLRKGLFVGVIAVTSFLVTTDLQSGAKLQIVIDAAELSAFLLSYLLSFHTKRYRLIYNFTIASVMLSTVMGFYSPAAVRSIFLAPITALIGYLLLSRFGGVLWTFLIEIFTLAAYLMDKQGLFKLQLDHNLLRFGIISTVIVSGLMYVYEEINVSNERLIGLHDKKLLDLNIELSQQVMNNKASADELKETLDKAQQSNESLHNTKLAIMNILDDTNDLQDQLRIEKEGIEKLVLERTDELRYEQIRLRASINSFGSGFLMTFKVEQEAIYNPALLAVFNLELSDKKINNIKTGDLMSLVQDKLGSAFDLAGAILTTEKSAKPFTVLNVALEDKYLSITGAPIVLNDSKEVIGCVILIEDKTEAMNLERSKDEFLSIASHELRTPLTVIRGNASMFESMYADQLPDEDSKLMLTDIKNSSVRLIGIVNQFLSTSRLEQKRTEFVMVPVDLSKKLLASVSALRPLADEKNLQLTTEIPADLPKVITDESRIEEVIVNIIGNAIKYTDKGSVKVVARAVKGNVEVDVIDTGIGIEHKNIDLLFHKFQQASSNILTRDATKSTGLGLYITKMLIDEMKGTIFLKESELGKGSIFTFTLPIAKHKE